MKWILKALAWAWAWARARWSDWSDPLGAASPPPARTAHGERLPYGHLTADAVWKYAHPTSAVLAAADPWEVDRRLRKFGDGERWAEAIDVIRASAVQASMPGAGALAGAAQAQKLKAFADLADLSRKVFDLKTVAEAGENGWTDGAAFLLLTDYLAAVAQLGSEFLPLPKSLA